MLRIKKLPGGFCAIFVFIAVSCNYSSGVRDRLIEDPDSSESTFEYKGERHFITGYEPLHADGEINVVVEIPAGTIEKWETDILSGSIMPELEFGNPRVIEYIGYPGNYGMIPGTLQALESGGDGDPLDVIVLGPPVKRGNVIKCKLIGVLEMLDDGETDDKLIAVLPNTSFYEVNSISELNEKFGGVTGILELWFTNYKGTGRIEIKGFGDQKRAREILESTIKAYQLYGAAL